MILSLGGFKKLVRGRFAIMLFAAVALAPAAVSAQNASSNDFNDEPAAVEPNQGGGPWGNSAGSSIGTRDNSSTERQATDPRLGPGGGTLGRPAGPTPDATGGPGGNPDVPFDTSMTLMFLAGGIVFAYVVYRRRLKLKAVEAKQ